MRLRTLTTLISVLALPLAAQFGGLGGGVNPFSSIGGGADKSTGWHPWFSMNSGYSRPVSNSQQYNYSTPANAALSGGIGGYKHWGMKQIAGGYTGSVGYVNNSSRNQPKWRPAQVAHLSYAQQVSQRIQLSISQSGGISYGGYGVASGFGVNGIPGVSSPYGASSSLSGFEPGFSDPTSNGVVDNEIFNGRSRFYSGGVGLSYLFTQRLAASFAGGVALARRNIGLRGTNSYQGGGSLQYRVSQRMTIGGSASTSTSTYLGYFGGARTMSFSGHASYAISPSASVSFSAGAGQIHSEFMGTIALPDDLASILGISSVIAVSEAKSWSPSYNFSASKVTQMGAFAFSAGRGFSMGNGAVMAGVRDMASLSYSKAITQKIGMGLSAAVARNSGRVGIMRTTETAQAAASLSYRLIGGFGVGVNSGYRYVSIPSHSRRSDIYVGGGIHWSGKDMPFIF